MSQDLFQKDYWERKALEERRPASHPVVRHYALSKIREIQKTIRFRPDQRLLDLGCGNGFFSQPFSELCQTVGVDFSGRMLRANPLAQKIGMDANRLAFQDMAFDVVFCHALLHHVEDPGRVLSEMRRVSRKYVVVMEPNRANPLMWLFSAVVKEERAALQFSLGFLRELLEKNHLKVVEAFSHGWTVPNKTPALLLPLLKPLDFRQPWGMTHILIAER